MRWPLLCRCVCLCRKDQGDSLSDILHIFPALCQAPCRVNDICVYIGVRFCLQGANANGCMYVSLNICFFLLPAEDLFPTQSFVFSVNHTSLPLFRHLVRPPTLPSLAHVGNVITFWGLCWGEKRGEKEFKGTWCRERKRHLYVYPITTPACPKSPLQRTDAYSENSYFHPASSERVTVVMR